MVTAFQRLCPSCVSHSPPQAQEVRAMFREEDLAVVGLHTPFEHHGAMGPEALAAFAHEYRVGFPIGVDQPGMDALLRQGAVPERQGDAIPGPMGLGLAGQDVGTVGPPPLS